jgi:hypothetical protein
MGRMYYLMLVTLMLILPVGSVAVEAMMAAGVDSVSVVAKWFVFWSVGVRLIVAGLRQIINPAFTAKDIFQIDDTAATKIVLELGFATSCIGLVGVLSLWFQAWVWASAISGGLYLGLAGLVHVRSSHRNTKENAAMVSDLFVFAVLTISLLLAILRNV